MASLTSKSAEVDAAVSRDRNLEYNNNHNNTTSLHKGQQARTRRWCCFFENRLAALERAAETKFGAPHAGNKNAFKDLCSSFGDYLSAKATWVKVGVVLVVLIMLAFKAGWFHDAFFQSRWIDSSP
ncbi:hypothetical protein BKA61DRAFT_566997 [Leptodontidium sp. MPI-SDFR-AT-0119]|nr:hypothetical protein BKA61DRAFT_566997 [Leptodontidium sp. MPI-SDFR-AT-0119]